MNADIMSKLGLIRLCETGLCTLDVLEPQTLVMTFFLPGGRYRE